MISQEILKDAFQLSVSMMDLYAQMLKCNEYELANRIISHHAPIRKHLERVVLAGDKFERVESISFCLARCVDTRYWLKMIQMKHMVCPTCDDCADQLNYIIRHLLAAEDYERDYPITLQYQLN